MYEYYVNIWDELTLQPPIASHRDHGINYLT